MSSTSQSGNAEHCDPVIASIGFFHWPSRHGEPLLALCDALEHQQVNNAIIALPELFDLPMCHIPSSVRNSSFNQGFAKSLMSIAAKRDLVFVAGLITNEKCNMRNSSVIVTAYGQDPIRHKTWIEDEDNTHQGDCDGFVYDDPRKPSLLKTARIGDVELGSIICYEYDKPISQKVLTELRSPKSDARVRALVLHGRISDLAYTPHFPGVISIVANGYPNGASSCIVDVSGSTVNRSSSDRACEIGLFRLPT